MELNRAHPDALAKCPEHPSLLALVPFPVTRKDMFCLGIGCPKFQEQGMQLILNGNAPPVACLRPFHGTHAAVVGTTDGDSSAL